MKKNNKFVENIQICTYIGVYIRFGGDSILKNIIIWIRNNKKIVVIVIIIIIAILLGYYLYNKEENSYKLTNYKEERKENNNEKEVNKEETNKEGENINNNDEKNIIVEEMQKEIIVVHISGAVAKEGIVEVSLGKRISDVIEKAGGLLENANLDKINLAFKVEDGMKIHIPTNEEVEKEILNQYQDNRYVYDENVIQNSSNNSVKSNNKKSNNEKININTATEEKLDELPEVGESTAKKIITYRNKNGKFKSIEDIKNVSGIGDAKFEQIKDFIIV